jgi:HD superfamily phosphohydrolase
LFEYAEGLASRLRTEETLQNELNSAFDEIGFTDDFISGRIHEKSIGRQKKTTLIKDLVWGMMEFSPRDMEIIDTPVIQRLRDKKQLGLTFQVYPSADHSRFSHTLGVAHTARRYLKEIASSETEIRLQTTTKLSYAGSDLQVYRFTDDDERKRLTEVVVHAALMHDCGHFPFSHATEAALHDNLDHYTIGDWTARKLINEFSDCIPGLRKPRLAEMFSVLVVLSKRFRHFYKEVGLQTTSENEVEQRLNSIALLILGKPHQDDFPGLAQIISSNAVDADKVDYVQRDSKLCVTSREVVRVFLKQLWFQFVPVFHGLQGRSTMKN